MRYTRQNTLSFIPENFTNTLKQKKLTLIGCGGIGSPLAELLIRSGFLTLTLIDFDTIDETNLQRQTFEESDLNTNKTNALKKRLLKINKNAKITIINEKITNQNIKQYTQNSNLILDCTDNFETRQIINNHCEKTKTDWIYSGAIKTEIITCLFQGQDKLFKKIFPNPIQNEKCNQVGILASTTFASASLTLNQILKYFLNQFNNQSQNPTLIKQNLWTNQIHEIKLK